MTIFVIIHLTIALPITYNELEANMYRFYYRIGSCCYVRISNLTSPLIARTNKLDCYTITPNPILRNIDLIDIDDLVI